jgi:hypothetical protein
VLSVPESSGPPESLVEESDVGIDESVGVDESSFGGEDESWFVELVESTFASVIGEDESSPASSDTVVTGLPEPPHPAVTTLAHPIVIATSETQSTNGREVIGQAYRDPGLVRRAIEVPFAGTRGSRWDEHDSSVAS